MHLHRDSNPGPWNTMLLCPSTVLFKKFCLQCLESLAPKYCLLFRRYVSDILAITKLQLPFKKCLVVPKPKVSLSKHGFQF